MNVRDEIIIGAIPAELKGLPQCVVWRHEERDGKRTKVPINPRTGQRASCVNPRTWSDFDTACQAFERGGFDGIGFVFSKDDAYVGIDLDHCRNPQTGAIEGWAQEIVGRLHTYTEVSPSGHGLHIIAKGKLPIGSRRTGQIEMYDRDRYFTMTGDHLDGTPHDIQDREHEVRALHREIFESEKRKAEPLASGPAQTDEEVLRRISTTTHCDNFDRLAAGDFSDYVSQSEADLALCSILASATGGNAEQVDRLFRMSGLFREKWDTPHFADGKTYGEATIQKALTGTPSTAEARPWPQLDPAALYGLAGDIVRALEPHTEADSVALLVHSLAEFSCVIGPGSRVVLDGASNPLLFNVVLVGRTSKARKGTADKRIKGMFQGAIYGWTRGEARGNLSSGEGLVFAVRDPADDDPGVTDKRLYLVQAEFGNTLKIMGREGNSLSGVIRDAWDGEDLAPMTKHARINATAPHIVIVGHVTEEELKKHLTSTEACNGFGNRFAWVMVRRSKVLPFPSEPDEAAMFPLRTRLHDAVAFSTRSRTLKMSDKAKAAWAAVYPDLSEGEPGMVGALLGRAEAQVMRLTALYALLDKSNCIKQIHLEAALALWQYIEDSIRYIFGNSIGDPIASKILHGVRQHGKLSDSEIHDLFKRNVPKSTLETAKHQLLSRKLVHKEIEKTNGRPQILWTPGR